MQAEIFYFGYNGFGQVQHAPNSEIHTGHPYKLSSIDKQDKYPCIALSWSYIVINTNGHVKVYGFTSESSDSKVLKVEGDDICSVSAQNSTLLTVDRDGHCTLRTAPNFNEKSHKIKLCSAIAADKDEKICQVACGEMNSVCLTDKGKVCMLPNTTTLGPDVLTVQRLPLPVKIKSVSCGKEHVLLLSQLGDVYSYGLGSRGQLGHGQMTTPKLDTPKVIEALQGVGMLAVSAGGWHSAVISEIGDIYMWGWNESGQLGLPCKSLRNTGQNCNDEDVICIENVPHLLDMGEDTCVSRISCAARHTACTTECGKMYSWGWNAYGQLGHKDLVSRDKPTLVDYFSDAGLFVNNVVCGGWSTVAITRHLAESDN